jgi:hypothetical protein
MAAARAVAMEVVKEQAMVAAMVEARVVIMAAARAVAMEVETEVVRVVAKVEAAEAKRVAAREAARAVVLREAAMVGARVEVVMEKVRCAAQARTHAQTSPSAC